MYRTIKKWVDNKICYLVLFLFLVNITQGQEYKTDVFEKPNIIFFLTDDQRWDALGVAGNPVIRTPNIDRLASAGILFENAYVTTSICCVSRASILTGQYEIGHKIHNFSTNFHPTILANTYPALLKESGYMIGNIGKFGVGKTPPDSLYDYWIDTEPAGGGQPDYLIKRSDGSVIHDTDTINNAIQEFLSGYGSTSDNKPFCLSVNFKAPHEQDGYRPEYIIQDRYSEYYKDVVIPSPVTADPKYWEQLPEFFRTDSNFGRVRWKGLFGTPELFQENVKNYYRLITGVDDVVGNTIRKLEKLGVENNTIIIFMGDNGMFLGEHGIEGKWYGYEESIRVPLIIFDPRSEDKIQQYRATQMVLNIDLAPTILALSGVEAPETMDGIDLMGLIRGEVPERTDFFYQHYFLGSPGIPKVEGVVTQDLKYMKYIEHGYEELYDIKFDPHETTNLVQDPDYRLQFLKLQRRYQELRKIYSVPFHQSVMQDF